MWGPRQEDLQGCWSFHRRPGRAEHSSMEAHRGYPAEPGQPRAGRMVTSACATASDKACLHGNSTLSQDFLLYCFFFLIIIFFFKVWIPSCHRKSLLKLNEQVWSLGSPLLKSRTPADFDTSEFVLLEDYNISLYFFRKSIYKGATPSTPKYHREFIAVE